VHHPKMKHTYLMTLLIGLDRFGAALLFNMTDCCISSLCWMMLVSAKRITVTPGEVALAQRTLESLKPYRWQEELLLVIGRGLEWLSPGHCAASATADILTATRTITYLQP
jgi:hypothetical protein